jgi:hypothetical protein
MIPVRVLLIMASSDESIIAASIASDPSMGD